MILSFVNKKKSVSIVLPAGGATTAASEQYTTYLLEDSDTVFKNVCFTCYRKNYLYIEKYFDIEQS